MNPKTDTPKLHPAKVMTTAKKRKTEASGEEHSEIQIVTVRNPNRNVIDLGNSKATTLPPEFLTNSPPLKQIEIVGIIDDEYLVIRKPRPNDKHRQVIQALREALLNPTAPIPEAE